jgi:hypothetical protein
MRKRKGPTRKRKGPTRKRKRPTRKHAETQDDHDNIKPPIKLSGSIEWGGGGLDEWEYDDAEVEQAILRDYRRPKDGLKDFVMRLQDSSGWTYEVGLSHIKDGLYGGGFVASQEGEPSERGGVNCTITRAKNGILVAKGKWSEGDYMNDWEANLEAAK